MSNNGWDRLKDRRPHRQIISDQSHDAILRVIGCKDYALEHLGTDQPEEAASQGFVASALDFKFEDDLVETQADQLWPKLSPEGLSPLVLKKEDNAQAVSGELDPAKAPMPHEEDGVFWVDTQPDWLLFLSDLSEVTVITGRSFPQDERILVCGDAEVLVNSPHELRLYSIKRSRCTALRITANDALSRWRARPTLDFPKPSASALWSQPQSPLGLHLKILENSGHPVDALVALGLVYRAWAPTTPEERERAARGVRVGCHQRVDRWARQLSEAEVNAIERRAMATLHGLELHLDTLLASEPGPYDLSALADLISDRVALEALASLIALSRPPQVLIAALASLDERCLASVDRLSACGRPQLRWAQAERAHDMWWSPYLVDY